MPHRLLLSLIVSLSLNASDITELIPYLDLNATEGFRSHVTTPVAANAMRPDNNKTILMYAVWVGNEAAVTHLLDQGADVNARDAEGITPLMLAIFRDETPIALELIRRGADVNATADDGATPLLMSKIRNNKTLEAAITGE
jgi:ankyrin repeat protein